jgi:hypothetical protein
MTDPLVPPISHLSEAERQCTADGTLRDEDRAPVERHLSECAECTADVARLGAFIARAREPFAQAGNIPDLWPEIRARIEAGKVVALGAPAAQGAERRRRSRARGWWWIAGGTVAAAAAALAVAVALHGPGRSPAAATQAITEKRGERTVMQVADSSRVYEEQLLPLLEELELRRSMLPPATAAAIDHDLRLIDGAIAELQAALEEDPNNVALRQLLAASYRQKRDLLKLVDNAS